MPHPKAKLTERGRAEERDTGSVRLSISIPPEQHEYLERVAKQHRVSIAWVVRDAILQRMDAEAPLFAHQD